VVQPRPHSPTTSGTAPAEQPEGDCSKAPSPFADILCAVDGSRGSSEAVRQAIALCGPGTKLSFLAISHTVGVGLSAQADLSEPRARDALRDASWLAQKAGVHASTDLRAGAPPSDLLLSAREGHDLLVLGCHGGSRAGGIMLGSTATQIAHRTEGALLVARRTVDDGDFPRSLLLATDGSSGSWAATRTATRVAQACLSELRVVHVPDGTHPERYREVLRQIAVIEKLTGVIPLVIDTPGHPAERISEAARVGQSSLIVIGRRGLRGVKALGSVSERIMHRAPCSVLIVPAGDDR